MVNSTALFKPVGLGFNPHCLHIIFFDYVITITLLVKHNWTPPDSSGLQWTPPDSARLRWTPVDSSGLQYVSPPESTGQSPLGVRQTPADSTGLRRIPPDYNFKFGPCHTKIFRNLSPADSGGFRRSMWGSVKSSR